MSAATDRNINPQTAMDHEWYSYSAAVDRPPLRWPNGERVAVWVMPALEFLDLVRPDTPGQHPPAGGPLDVRHWSHRDYGNRWGIWRVMDVLDKYGIRATAAVNSVVADIYPDIVVAAQERSWEIMAHGEVNSSVITSKMAPDDELALIERSRDAIAAATGIVPFGWLSPQVSESLVTPRLLAEAGFTYCADWANDDQPFELLVPDGRLVAVPYSREVNDQVVIFQEMHPVWEWEQLARDHFDALYREGERSGMVMCIALHPYCIGQPMRIKYLDKLLGHISSHAGVWFATGSEIADHWTSQATSPA